MKKFLRILTLAISILLISSMVFANETMLITSSKPSSIRVQLNGEYLDFTDTAGNKVDPQIINDRTMVPMRKIFEVFGANVSWIAETRSIKANTADLEIGLQIDNKIATLKNKNGEVKEITLDSVPVIRDSRTLVPVRFIAESLNKKVGWDAQNRTVTITDTSFVEELLVKNSSNFYEYITTDFEKINTYEMDIAVKGKVKYEDKEDSSNNTTLNIVGNADLKLSENAIAFDLDVNLTGKGLLVETIKEQDLEKVEMNIVVDIQNSLMYMKMNVLEEAYGDKWIKYDLSKEADLKAILEMAKSAQGAGIDGMIDSLLPDETLTTSSYAELQNTMQLLTIFIGNENFKVSGRDTKTYTFNLDLSEIFEMIMKVNAADETYDNDIKLKIGFDVKVENKVAKESTCELIVEVAEAEENVAVTVEANAKLKNYNQKVTINMPKVADVLELESY